jgi:poly-gamma-glutamate synthesis protein (capsule biosynthesis protein)
MKNTLKFSVVGDIMLGEQLATRGIGTTTNMEKSGYKILDKVQQLLRDHDIVLGNMEATINFSSTWLPITCQKKHISFLKKAGFTVLSLANNHSLDYGKNQLDKTAKTLRNHNIEVIGYSDNQHIIKLIKGLRISILSFNMVQDKGHNHSCPFKGKESLKFIQSIKRKSDIVIVYIHWGREYVHQPTLEQISTAKQISSVGADLIIGHHPHVLQSYQLVGKTHVVYSLGNFLFDSFWNPPTLNSAIFSCSFLPNTIADVKFHYIRITRKSHIEFLPYEECRSLDQIIKADVIPVSHSQVRLAENINKWKMRKFILSNMLRYPKGHIKNMLKYALSKRVG